MTSRIMIRHQTRYAYERPVFLTTHFLRLKPAAHARTPVEEYQLSISPAQHILHWQQDPFGNFVARIDFMEPVQELLIGVEMRADITAINPFDFFLDEYARFYPFTYEPQLEKALGLYLEVTDKGPKMMEWLEKADRSKLDIVDFLIMVNNMVNRDIGYTVRMEPGVQTSEESLALALGSCRDSGWLLVQIFRNMGLAARFVSGYLVQLGADPGGDSTALHAWAEVYIPGAGWIGLDPTSGLLAGEGHIPLACTPSHESAAPITGTSEIVNTDFTYSSTVTRLD